AARARRGAPAVRTTVGVEPDRSHLVVEQVVLCRKELQVDAGWQRVHARIGRHAKGARGHVELENGFRPLRDRLSARKPQSGGDLARRGGGRREGGARAAAARERGSRRWRGPPPAKKPQSGGDLARRGLELGG